MARRKTEKRIHEDAVKATEFEALKRVNETYKMLLIGLSRGDIIQYASEKWGIGDRATDEYISKARALFSEQSKTIRDEEMGKALGRLQNLYEKNMKIQDYKAALATQKEINALLGLYAPTKNEHTGANGGAIETKATIILKTGMDIDEL